MQHSDPPTSHWLLHHIPLNATKPSKWNLRFVKEQQTPLGVFLVDDIKLSDTECPHYVWHILKFDEFLTSSRVGASLLSPQFLTYGLQLLLHLYSDHFGVFFRLVSTDHEDQL
ncbi:hypothetical protein LDENG_00153010 [Lucifuga dentata]|nr:hypothetical protein LDENG_00153010 [Lucifuga dentata]